MFNDRTLRHDTKENRIFWSPRLSQITPGWKKLWLVKYMIACSAFICDLFGKKLPRTRLKMCRDSEIQQ